MKKRKAGGPKASPGLECSRCGGRVRKLPGNGISPLPTYQCRRCDTKLTTTSGRALHAVVGLIGLVLFVAGAGMALTGDVNVRPKGLLVLALAVGVAGYCGVALTRPVVAQAEPDEDDEDESDD